MGLYDFWATPDDENCLEKCYYATKYSAVGGALFSFYEMALGSKPVTIVGCVGRFINFTVPFAISGFTFSTTTCLLSQVRKKDDYINHVAACFTACSVWALKYNTLRSPVLCALVLSSGLGYIKLMRSNNWPMYRTVPIDQRRCYPFFNRSIKMYDDPGRPKSWTYQD